MTNSTATSEDRGVLLKALKESLDVERKGEAFYRSASEKVKNPHGRLTLGFLAGEEKRHWDYLQKVLRALEDGTPIVESPMPKRSRLHKEEILGRMKRMGVSLTVPENNKKIVRRAMEIEKKSIEFYRDLQGEVKDVDVLRVFRELEGEERNHLEWLEFILEALELHGYWYDLESHFALDG